MGEKFDAKKGEVLHAGASFALPPSTLEETILELVATGPWGVEYLDPADDPRRQGKTHARAVLMGGQFCGPSSPIPLPSAPERETGHALER